MKKIILLLIILPLITSCSGVDLSTDEDAMSYLISYDFAQSQRFESGKLKMIAEAVKNYPEMNSDYSNDVSYAACFKHLVGLKSSNIIIDKKSYLKGFEDSIKGIKSAIDPERANVIRNKYYNIISSKNTISTEEFEKSLKNDKIINRTNSGLYYKIIKQGNGQNPGKSDRITAHMIGRLPNGYEFSNTYLKQTPVQFYINTTINGMIEGLQLMKAGSRYVFYIPPKLGYGGKQKGIIPANSYMVYEIELLDVKKR